MKKKPNRENQKKDFIEAPCLPLSLSFPVTRHSSLVTLLLSISSVDSHHPSHCRRNIPSSNRPSPVGSMNFPEITGCTGNSKLNGGITTDISRVLKDGASGIKSLFSGWDWSRVRCRRKAPAGESRMSIWPIWRFPTLVIKDFLYREKADRGNLGLAGADADQYRIWVENWEGDRERNQPSNHCR